MTHNSDQITSIAPKAIQQNRALIISKAAHCSTSLISMPRWEVEQHVLQRSLKIYAWLNDKVGPIQDTLPTILQRHFGITVMFCHNLWSFTSSCTSASCYEK